MKTTYLALVLIGAGSCWQYSDTIDKAVDGVKRRTKADWSSLFKFKKGTELKVNVYDVTHVPNGAEMRFDADGVRWLDGDQYRKIDRLELVTTTF